MKIIYRQYNAVASWRWDVKPLTQPEAGSSENPQLQGTIQSDLNSASEDDESDEDNDDEEEEDEEDEVCGICQLEFESACPGCKVPGDDCPLMWGQCTHVFHMHCLLKWLNTPSSNEQCPLDRRPWVTAERDMSSHGVHQPGTVDQAPNETTLAARASIGYGDPLVEEDYSSRSMMTIGEESGDSGLITSTMHGDTARV